MSMFVPRVSFWRQNSSWRASQTRANDQFLSGNDSSYGAFGLGNPNKVNYMASIGNVATNYYLSAAVLAAQQGVDRINQAAEAKTASKTKAVGDISNNVSFSGSLSGAVNFGADGPSASGGFQFVTGSELTEAFKLAMLGERSHGAAIDSVSVTGNTLTASTSGSDAHPVFTLTLRPNSGMWTFTLVNPIDGVPSKDDSFITSINLSRLMHGVKSNGQTIALPNNIVVSIYGDQTYATGTATKGSVHQGGLEYTPPANITAPVTLIEQTPYEPPINPATGYAYVTTSSLSAGGSASVNLFA